MKRKTLLLPTLLAGLGLANANATLLVQELFDGLNGNLNGAGDSTAAMGFEPGTTWAANANSTAAINSLMVANNFNVDTAVTNAKPWQLGAGNANRGGIWWNAGTWDTGSWAARQLASGSQLNLGADGVYYLAFNLTYKSDDSLGFGFATGSGDTSQFIAIGPNWNNTSFNSNASAKRLAVARGSALNVPPGVSGANAYSTAQFVNNLNYLVLVKITASASGNDTLQAAFFQPSRAGYGILPANEASVVWDLTYTFSDSATYTHLLAFINGGTYYANLDSFRLGTAYADVVQSQPRITSQPSPSPASTVYAGVTVSLGVAVTGGLPEPYSYQWWKGPDAVGNATNATLVLSNTVVGTSGDYYVVVANSYGAATSITNTITILPANPPVLTSDVQPLSPTRVVGGSVAFSAGIDGTPPFSYQWKHEGTNLPGATNVTLLVSDLTLASAGSYALYVTNNFGWTNTAAAALTLLTPAAGSYEEMILTNKPIAYWRLNEGAYAYDAPSVAYDYVGGYDAYHTNTYTIDGLRPPSYLGMETSNNGAYYNGGAASSTTASLMNNLGQFTLMGWFNPAVWPQQTAAGSGRVALFGQNDAAEFGFHGTNVIGMWTPGGGYVSFDASTLVSAGNWYFIVAVGDGSRITFHLNGNEAASLAQSTTNYGASSYPFRIGYGVLDAGANEFQGTIDEVALFNRALSVAEVNALYSKAVGVAQPPSLLLQPTGGTRYVTQSKTFTATAAGTLPLYYQWRHAGTEIPGATNNYLTLTNLTAAAAGAYDVVVTNRAGVTNSAEATLTVIAPSAGSYEAAAIGLNPVAYYRYNETAGSTVAYDYWGGYDGTVNANATMGLPGPTNPPFAGFEALNTALGVTNAIASSFVSCPAFHLNTNSVTLSAWVYADGSQGGWRGIVYSRAGNTTAGIHTGNGNELRYTWNDAGDTWGWDSGLQIPVGEWCFVALTIEPAQATLYLGTASGFKSATHAATHPNEEFDGATLIGKDGQNDGRTWNGLIDEVLILNRALSATDIFTLYQKATALQLKVSLERLKVFVPDTKPTGTPFDGVGYGTAWVASSTDALARTRTGVMEFVETNASQVVVPPHPEFDTPKGTMCFWIRSGDTELNNGAMILDRRGGNGEILVLGTGGLINWQPSWLYPDSTTASVTDGNWHHVAYVYDQTATGYSSVYVDGALDKTHVNPSAWTWDGRQIELGFSHDGYWDRLNGQLDDVRFYNRELTGAEVGQIYGGDSPLVGGADLVGRYDFDTDLQPGLRLTWSAGVLEAADEVTGPYTPVTGATSPLILKPADAKKFYRAKVQ